MNREDQLLDENFGEHADDSVEREREQRIAKAKADRLQGLKNWLQNAKPELRLAAEPNDEIISDWEERFNVVAKHNPHNDTISFFRDSEDPAKGHKAGQPIAVADIIRGALANNPQLAATYQAEKADLMDEINGQPRDEAGRFTPGHVPTHTVPGFKQDILATEVENNARRQLASWIDKDGEPTDSPMTNPEFKRVLLATGLVTPEAIGLLHGAFLHRQDRELADRVTLADIAKMIESGEWSKKSQSFKTRVTHRFPGTDGIEKVLSTHRASGAVNSLNGNVTGLSGNAYRLYCRGYSREDAVRIGAQMDEADVKKRAVKK